MGFLITPVYGIRVGGIPDGLENRNPLGKKPPEKLPGQAFSILEEWNVYPKPSGGARREAAIARNPSSGKPVLPRLTPVHGIPIVSL